MKKRREMEKRPESEIKSAIEELSLLAKLKKPSEKFEDAHIPTRPFLHLCNLMIQVLDKIGPTMAVLRQDIHQNIQRLEMVCASDPSRYLSLVDILRKEDSEGITRTSTSCSRSFLWLTRSLDFTVALLQRLVKEPGEHMEHIVEEAYNATLKPYHGWISLAAYKVTVECSFLSPPPIVKNFLPVISCPYSRTRTNTFPVQIALKLLPDRKTFEYLIMVKDGNYENLKEDVHTYVSLLSPVLEDIHCILRSYRLDKLKST